LPSCPRRAHDGNGTRSTISGSTGHSPAGTGWQYSALVRRQVPFVRNTNPSGPIGSRTKKGSVLSESGLRPISSSTTTQSANRSDANREMTPGPSRQA
jgi:hypothetical protein